MTIDDEERAIILAEIYRLQKAYDNAQERYGTTGSPSTDRTMHKYQTLMMALEAALRPEGENERHWQRQVDKYWVQLRRAYETVLRYAQAGRIPADAANVISMILRE